MPRAKAKPEEKPEPRNTGIYISGDAPDAARVAEAVIDLLQVAFDTHMDQQVVMAALRVLEQGTKVTPTTVSNCTISMGGSGVSGGGGGAAGYNGLGLRT